MVDVAYVHPIGRRFRTVRRSADGVRVCDGYCVLCFYDTDNKRGGTMMGVWYCDACHKYIDDDTTDECQGWEELPDICEIFPPEPGDSPLTQPWSDDL